MNVRDVAYPWVIGVEGTDPLLRAVTRMRTFGVGSVVVYAGEALVGVLTERDLLRAVTDGADVRRTRVHDYVSSEPETIDADADVAAAAAAMLGVNARHLPVIDAGRVVGMVSARDLLHAVAGDRPRRRRPPPRTRWERFWRRAPKRWGPAELGAFDPQRMGGA